MSTILRPSERRPKKETVVASQSKGSSLRPRATSTASSTNSSTAHTTSSTLPNSKQVSRPTSVSSRTRTPLRGHALQHHGGDAVEMVSSSRHATMARHMMEAEAFGGDGPRTPPPAAHLVNTPRFSSGGRTPTSPKRGSQSERTSPSRRAGGARHDDPVVKLRLDLAEADRHAQQQIAETVAMNQQLLDNMAERRRRAEMLTQLYRDDAHQTSIELATAEGEWRELQDKRRHLIELSRTLELQLYQKRKAQQASNGSHHNAGAAPRNTVARNNTSAPLPAPPQLQSSSSQPSTRAQYEELNRRLDAAKFVADELTSEITKAERQEADKTNERTTLMSLVMDLRKEVSALEQHEVFVSGVVRESKHVIENAGSMASRLPHMERVVNELVYAEKQIRQDFAKTQQHLMGFIQSDDASIEQLREVVQSRNGASGALPSLLRQLQLENELMQRFSHAYLEEAEEERSAMQQTADKLQQRLLAIEEKTRGLTMQPRSH